MKKFLLGIGIVLVVLFLALMGYLAIHSPAKACEFGPCTAEGLAAPSEP